MATSRLTRAALAVGIAGVSAGVVFVITPTTFGDFTAATDNTGNTVQAGTLDMTNSFGGVASQSQGDASTGALFVTSSPSPAPSATPVLTDNLKPGASPSASVTITNSGSLPAQMSLTVQNVLATCVAKSGTGACGFDHNWGDGDLSSELTITVTDEANHVVISGVTLAAAMTHGAYDLPPSQATPWAPLEFHSYTVAVTFPSSAGNEYQGTGASFDLHWVGTQA